MEKISKIRTQMAFDLEPEIRMKIKMLALRRNITVSTWMKRAVFERIAKEERKEPED